MTKFIEKDKAVELIFLVATTGRTTEALKLLGKESVEANPVVHAKWIEDEYAFAACNHCMHELEYPEYKTPYCPHCGARMDGGESNG